MEEIKHVATRSMGRALGMTCHESTDKGIMANIDEWATNKYPVIELLSQSPDWNPETLSIVKRVNYLYNAPRHQSEDAFRGMMNMVREVARRDKLDYAQDIIRLFTMAVEGLLRYPKVPITSERVEKKDEALFISEVCGYDRANPGMKWSRLIQGLFKKWGIPLDTEKALTMKYSEWVDAITEKNAEYLMTISVNPADYLLMAYGNTWSSCHVIDPEIARGSGSYNGIHKGGCLDYMNDGPTVMVQLLDKNTNPIESPMEPRIHRNIFFLDPKLMTVSQSKLYPNGGDLSVRGLLMKEFQKSLEEIWGKGYWEERTGRMRRIGHLHYPDYQYVDVPHNVFTPEGALSNVQPEYRIGAAAHCIECGEEYEKCDELTCDYCRGERERVYCHHCGEEINEDAYYSPTTNYYYCPEHYEELFVRCHYCQDEFPQGSDSIIRHDGTPYCTICHARIFANCDRCGTTTRRQRLRSVEDEAWCPDCAEQNRCAIPLL